ncbi:MAG: hypothetical protein JXN61_10810, partial [Sedimentisphaerales bacterium]|nr:hypothetical protein [Sedimentisphaerales bacterium]
MDIKTTTKADRIKWMKTAITLLIPALLWIIPSNVAYLIAQNRDVLLDRYSLGHLTVAIFLIPIAAASLYLTWVNEKNERQRQFKVLAITISILFTLIVTDTAARIIIRPKRYVEEETYFHRPPSTVQTGTARDVPEEAFLYPRTPPGYPDIEYTLTTDKRGFRNKTDLERYDIAILGDSFAEGSRVTDQDAWPILLADKTAQKIYNLGMSSGHPGTYLETLKKFGAELSPRTVICLLYEGNDFRDDNYRKENSIGRNIQEYFKRSPVRRGIERFLLRCFASKPPAPGADSPENAAKSADTAGNTLAAVAWLPVAVPKGPNGKYYTFKVKRLVEHFVTSEEFLESEGVKKTFAALRDIKRMCGDRKIRLIIAYAPDKPHLIVPLITGIVPPEQLRAFMELKQTELPPAETLYETLIPRLEVQESAVREFCRAESIEFLSLTRPLRKAIAQGNQTYFTYDQHWTPPGHIIVADTI